MPIRPVGRRGLGRSGGGRLSSGARRLRPLFERRGSRRTRPSDAVSCNLGEVLNLSAGGLRVRATRRLCGRLKVELSTPSDSVQLQAEVRWAKRDGLRRFDVGLEFRDLTPDLAAQLARITSER